MYRKLYNIFCFIFILTSALFITGCGSDDTYVFVPAVDDSENSALKHTVVTVDGQNTVLNTSSFILTLPEGSFPQGSSVFVTEDINLKGISSYLPPDFIPQSSLLNISSSLGHVGSLRFSSGILRAGKSIDQLFFKNGQGRISVRMSNTSSYDSNLDYFMAFRHIENGISKWEFFRTEYADGMFSSEFCSVYDSILLVSRDRKLSKSISKSPVIKGSSIVSAAQSQENTFYGDEPYNISGEYAADANFDCAKMTVEFYSVDKQADLHLGSSFIKDYKLSMINSGGIFCALPAFLKNFADYNSLGLNFNYDFKLNLKDVKALQFPSALIMRVVYRSDNSEVYTAEKLIRFVSNAKPDFLPEVESVSPEDKSTILKSMADGVKIVFKQHLPDEKIEQTSFIGALKLYEEGKSEEYVCALKQVSPNGMTAYYNADFKAETVYRAELSTQITNNYGHNLKGKYVWNFRVSGNSGISSVKVLDRDGKTLINAVSAVNVATNTYILAEYPKEVKNTKDINISIKDSATGFDVIWNADRKGFKIQLGQCLDYNDKVKLSVSGGKDIYGIPLDNYECSFTTAKQTTVKKRLPDNGSIDHDALTPASIVFSEAMPGEFSEYLSVEEKIAGSWNKIDNSNLTFEYIQNNNEMRVIPNGNEWNYNADYKIALLDGLKDTYNNLVRTDVKEWTFKTKANKPSVLTPNVSDITRFSAKISFKLSPGGTGRIKTDSVKVKVVEENLDVSNESAKEFKAVLANDIYTADLKELTRNKNYDFYVLFSIDKDNTEHCLSGIPFKTLTWDGKGEESDPYLISSAEELADIKDSWSGKYFRQTLPIALPANWIPLCSGNDKPFKGTYDGNDKTITGLIINDATKDTAGLFGICHSGTIKNLTLSGVTITASSRIGSIVGRAKDSRFENIKVLADSITGSNSSATFVGGLVGYAEDRCIFSECSVNANTGTFSVNGPVGAGGFVGLAKLRCSFENCKVSNGRIGISNSKEQVGLFAGSQSGCTIGSALGGITIENSEAVAPDIIGGVVGQSESGIISNVSIYKCSIKATADTTKQCDIICGNKKSGEGIQTTSVNSCVIKESSKTVRGVITNYDENNYNE